ncbi:MAG: insulinase family protein, partial [Acidobacteriota bacterium]|nr:insulinase family protein [Acidobacteriota bacterium]
GRPYGHENLGAASALGRMTIADLQAFYKEQYTQANLTIGLAGGYPADFMARVKKDFADLPAGKPNEFAFPPPEKLSHNQVTLIQKDTRSVAWSLGFPIDVKRGDPDYPALLVMQSWLGQHRLGGRLFERMREVRGLNYGDYDYIEYFPGGMFRFEPPPNIARHQQIFQIWIRPVEPPTAVFSLRLAMYELDRLVKTGLTQAEFEQARSFVSKYINVLTKTKSAELGYAIDSAWYGIPGYNEYVKSALAKLTLADLNGAIRRNLRAENIQIAGVAGNADEIKAALISGDASPIKYNSPKPQEVMDEDKIVEKFPLHLRAEDVKIVPVATVFED